MTETYRIGELAARTGLTVRTLHHYDEIGLLTPANRSGSGHRRYGPAEVERLHRIVALRQLGFSLEEIRDCLGRPGFALREVIALRISRLRERIEAERRLCERLQALQDQLAEAGTVSAAEILQTIEAMTMFEKYYTPEQLNQLEERRATVGEERIREVEQEWPRLIAEVRAEMEEGTDPSDPRVRELARRWKALVAEFTGGDPGIERSVGNLYQHEPTAGERMGLDRDLFDYVGRAM